MKCECGGTIELWSENAMCLKCKRVYLLRDLLEKAESDLAEQKAKCDLCHEAQYQEYAKVKAELDRVFKTLCENCFHKTEPDWCEENYNTCPLIRGEGK